MGVLQKDLEEVRERFKNDLFALTMGAQIEKVDDGYAMCSLILEERHQNAAGTVMGGAIFTLADFAFGVAANWNKPPTVSLSSQISYLNIARGTALVAEARLVKEGRTTCYYNIEVRDDLDNLVAVVTCNGFIKR